MTDEASFERPQIPSPAVAAQAPTLIVGIGASAGGTDALREFFSSLDEGADMALVVIEHLDPQSKSLLPSVLHRFTGLDVVEIGDGMAVVPNRVFAVPPGQAVALENG